MSGPSESAGPETYGRFWAPVLEHFFWLGLQTPTLDATGPDHVFNHPPGAYRTGGSTGEAWGKLGEARYFWGKHRICTLEFLEKTGEAIGPSNLFIILKRMIRDQGDEGYGPLVAWGRLLEFYHRAAVSE